MTGFSRTSRGVDIARRAAAALVLLAGLAVPPATLAVRLPAAPSSDSTVEPAAVGIAAVTTITGTVRDANRTGIPGVWVSVNPQSPPGQYVGTSTAADGSFTLSATDGVYVVNFYPPSETGFVNGYYYSGTKTLWTDDYSLATRITISGGNLALGTVTVPRGARIRGRVTASDGTGLANVTVSGSNLTWTRSLWTMTDANGDFTTNATVADQFRLEVRPPQGSAQVAGWYAQGAIGSWAPTQELATAVTVATTDILLGAIVPVTGARLSGTVRDATSGAGIPNAQVQIQPVGPGSYAFASADAKGDFTTGALLPGTFRVRISPGPWLPSDLVPGYYSAGSTNNYAPTATAATQLALDGSDVTGIDVALPTGRRLSGTVVGQDGLPVSGDTWGTSVSVCPAGSWECGGVGLESGAFSVPVLEGSYTIRVDTSGPDLLSGYFAAGTPGKWARSLPGATLIPVGATDVSVGTIVLPRGWGIAGTVRDTSGALLVGAWVSACPATGDGSGCGWAQTNAAGTYRTSAVAPGSYVVAINPPPGGTQIGGLYRSGVTGNWTLDQASATPVLVGTADATGIDVSLPVGRRITGTITTNLGTGLAGAQIVACPTTGWGRCGVGTSTANGTYATGGLLPGQYRVEVQAPSTSAQVSGTYRLDSTTGNWTQDLLNATPVTVGSTADVTGINVRLPAGRRIRGLIQDDAGQPVKDAYVTICGIGTWSCPAFPSDATGEFASGGLLTGSYLVSVRAPDGTDLLGGYYAASSQLTPDRDLATPMTLSTSDGSTGVLVLVPGLTLTGSITDGSKAVSGAWVQLCPLRGDCVHGGTDFAGRYRTNAVPPGRYRLTVQAPWRSDLVSGAYDPTTPGGIGDYPGRSIDITEGTAPLDLTFSQGIRPHGTVRDASGQPVAGAQVSVGTAAPGSYRGTGAMSGADGEFIADGAVPDGTYRFSVIPPEGTNLASGPTVIVGTLQQPVELTLGTGWLVSGRVTAPDGSGVAGAWVSVFGSSPGGYAWARTDPAGDFTTRTGLPPATDYLMSVDPPQDSSLVGGRYSATAPGGYTPDWDGATRISLTSGDATGLSIRLPLGSAVAGRILGSNGESVAGANVVACSPGNCRGALTSATGSFRTGALADGAVEVYVFPPEGSSYIGGYLGSDPVTRFTTRWSERTTLTLKGADVTGVTIRIRTGIRIGGTLVGSDDDQPVPDVGVSVFGASEGTYGSYGVTTSLGTFRTGGVATDSGYLVKIGWDDPASPYASGWYSSSADGYFTPFASRASALAVGSTDASTGVIRVPKGHRISGKVSFTDGSSPRWVQATLEPADAVCGETAAIWPLQTDETGAFFFTGIPDGSYRIRLYGGYYRADGYSVDPGAAIVVAGGDVTLDPLELPEGASSDATPIGDCVKVTPTDESTGATPASITFETIDGQGSTTIRAMDASATAAVYDIDTTADYTGDTLVCISYDGLDLPEGTTPRLYHENSDGTWVDITVSVDLVGHFVCGYTTSFSPFAVSSKAASVALELSGSGAGTVRVSGRACTTSCTLDLTFGTTVTITAEASAGSRFLGWSGACANTSGDCIVELLGRRTLTARFSRPTVGTMSPTSGGVGQSISLSGGDLAGVTRVEFNGVPALFTVLSSTRVVTSVPTGATTGRIRAFIGDFSTVTAANFTVGTKAVVPTVTALRPAAVRAGMRVTVTGTNLAGVKAASVNGVAIVTTGDGLVRVDATTITFVVPLGATSGVVRVTTDGGTSASTLALTILPPPVRLAGGGSHSCAALVDGTVRCWGANGSGQLGNGGTTASVNPVVVTGLAGVTAVVAGSSHSCALLSATTVRCWGANTNGQIGDGSTSVRKTPVVVRTSAASAVALPNVTAIAAGASHTCALISGGTVRCWGLNSSGQLGDGTLVQRTSPVTVTDGSGPLSGVTAIAAGGNTTCATVTDGAVRCWGANESGQLGISSTTGSTRPSSVTDGTTGLPLTGVTALSVGGTPAAPGAVARTHACAVIGATGSVRCWGSNAAGQLGIGTSGGIRTSPASVSDGSGGELTGATAVAAGAEHTCAIVGPGGSASIRCWGLNANGQLGDGTQTSRSFPTLVAGSADPWSPAGSLWLACGSGHTMAIAGNDVYVPLAAALWGSNASGQLGLPLTTPRMTKPALLRTL